MNRLAVIGAGGHTRSLINLLLCRFDSDEISIFDDSFKKETDEKILSCSVYGKISHIDSRFQVVVSIGDNQRRKHYFLKFQKQIFKENLFHKSSMVEQSARLGVSNQVFANSYINSLACIGSNNIINSSSIIEHDCIIGSHNHISVGAIVCGKSHIGNGCFIGAGAIINNHIAIGDNVLIGSGSVVTKDIVNPGVYVGVPARRIK